MKMPNHLRRSEIESLSQHFERFPGAYFGGNGGRRHLDAEELRLADSLAYPAVIVESNLRDGMPVYALVWKLKNMVDLDASWYLAQHDLTVIKSPVELKVIHTEFMFSDECFFYYHDWTQVVKDSKEDDGFKPPVTKRDYIYLYKGELIVRGSFGAISETMAKVIEQKIPQ